MVTRIGFSSDRTATGPWPADRVMGAQTGLKRRVLPGSLDEMERCCQALETRRAQGDVRGMATCCLQLGDLFLRRGDTELAEQMYRRALMLSRNLLREQRAERH